MPPRLLTPRTWTPATPTRADSMGTPTMVSASSTARRMELTARSRFTIWPLRQPFDPAAPKAAKRTPPSSSISATSAQVLALPMSSATMCRSFFVKSDTPWFPFCFDAATSDSPIPIRRFQFVRCAVVLARVFSRLFWRRAMRRLRDGGAGRFVTGLRDQRAIRIHDGFAVETQIHGFDAAGFGPPFADIVEHGEEFVFEIAVAEMDDDGRVGLSGPLIVSGAVQGTATLQVGNGGAQIFRFGQVDFADFFHGAGARSFRADSETGKKFHAFFAIFERHAQVHSGDDRKMKIAFQRARKDHAVGVDEFHLIAGAEESDGRAFGDVDFDGVGQRAANDGLFDPGERFDLAPAGVERDAQDAVVAVAAENFAHAIGGDVVGFGNLHLVGMNQ